MLEVLKSLELFHHAWIYWVALTVFAFCILSSVANKTATGFIASVTGYYLLLAFFSKFDMFRIEYLFGALGYLSVGLTYSLIRAYFKGRKYRYKVSMSKDDLKEKLDKVKDEFVLYIVAFPLAFLESLLTEWIDVIVEAVKEKFSGLVDKIFTLGAGR